MNLLALVARTALVLEINNLRCGAEFGLRHEVLFWQGE